MKHTQSNIKTITVKVITLILMLVLAISGMNIGKAEAASPSCGFYADGTIIRDANGNPFVIRGINVAHAWFTGETETSIKAIAKTGANAVRVVLSDGQVYTRTTRKEIQDIIKWCKENKLVCILDVHDTTGDDSMNSLKEAADFWISINDILIEEKDYVIVNLANECHGTWNGYSWAQGYIEQIPRLRNAGICNMIMVDCAGWGQYPDSIKDYGKSVFESDIDRNICFSIHMYEYAGENPEIVRTNIDNALSIGVPVVIGEFAAQHTNGDVAEEEIMRYCEEKQVGYIGWSWKGNNQDLHYLDISNDWNGTSLTEWGNILINGANGIRQTSHICSIYSSGEDDYISLFWGESSAGAWEQAVSVTTLKNGGIFNAADITYNGYFYIEYSSDSVPELNLQSWSGANEWAKVQPFETGYANGHKYAKYSYNDCVTQFGTDDFAGKLDKICVTATESPITVYSLCYCYPG